jgi:polyhydroxyalkanoate synthesis regulator phasin
MSEPEKPADKPDGEDEPRRRSFQDALRETWTSALGVFATAEGEINRATARLMEVLGRPTEEAQHLIDDLSTRMRENRAAFERRVEESVRTASDRLRGQLAQEVSALRQRVEALGARIEAEVQKRTPPGEGGGGEPPK